MALRRADGPMLLHLQKWICDSFPWAIEVALDQCRFCDSDWGRFRVPGGRRSALDDLRQGRETGHSEDFDRLPPERFGFSTRTYLTNLPLTRLQSGCRTLGNRDFVRRRREESSLPGRRQPSPGRRNRPRGRPGSRADSRTGNHENMEARRGDMGDHQAAHRKGSRDGFHLRVRR